MAIEATATTGHDDAAEGIKDSDKQAVRNASASKSFMQRLNPYIITGACLLSAAFVGIVGPKIARGGDGYVNYVLPAAPCFVVMIMIEFVLSSLTKRKGQAAGYDLADSWGSMSAGSSQIVVLTFVASTIQKVVAPYFGYNIVWNNFSIVQLDAEAWSTWIASLLAFDFIFYWAHRFGHTCALFWAGHKVHHSSEHYNLTTALRQSWFQGVCTLALPLPFALFIPPKVFFTTSAWNIIYQFWVHTCLVDRLGVLEWVFSTPSHHRIHHDRRLHKNYGGILIIWDRLFGTFMDEYDSLRAHQFVRGDEEITLFGIQQPVHTWLEPPLQLTGFKMIWDRMVKKWKRGEGLLAALKCLVIGPGFYTTLAHRVVAPPMRESTRLRLHRPLPQSLLSKLYFCLQFAETVLLSVVIGFFAPSVSAWATTALTAYYILTVTTVALYLDRSRLHAYVHALKCTLAFAAFLPTVLPLIVHDAEAYLAESWDVSFDDKRAMNIAYVIAGSQHLLGLLLQMTQSL